MKNIIINISIHKGNTEKIAKAIASVLNCELKTPKEIHPEELYQYDLIGFGSGIYSSKHHTELLDLVDRLPYVTSKNAFIFSTCGAPAFAVDGGHVNEYIVKSHAPLREKLRAKGYTIVDEFNCPGWNTNSFLKLFGGINKGRPNAEDLTNAERFAENLKK